MLLKRRTRLKLLVTGVIACMAIFVLGDLVYSRVVSYRHAKWEAGIRRDEDGVREGCQTFAVGEGDTAILLVHGINDSAHFYYKMAPRLAAAGFACHAIRLPGFAQPTAVYAEATTQDWGAAVAKKANALRTSHRRVYVVAHSLGAAIVIQHLLEQPDAADGVVLLAPGIAVGSQRSPLLPVRCWHALGRRTLVFTQLTESPFGVDAEDPAEAASRYRTPFTPRSTIEQTIKLFDQNRGRAAEFQTPLLMVLGAHDRVIDVSAAQEFYEQTRSTPKQLLEMPHAAHALAVDHGWEELTDEIARFVHSTE